MTECPCCYRRAAAVVRVDGGGVDVERVDEDLGADPCVSDNGRGTKRVYLHFSETSAVPERGRA